MPWWASVYFLGYGCFTAAWARDELADRPERPYVVVEILSAACLVLVALGYWLSEVRAALGSAAPVLFVAGCGWLAAATIRETRRYRPNPDLSRALNFASVVIGVGLYILLSGPLFYWGFVYAVRGNVAGT
jgi:predicted MFS family arabinose efflux permease